MAKGLGKIRKAVEQPELVFTYDEHEKRLAYDVRRFKALKNQFRPVWQLVRLPSWSDS
jgi:hypothetical protein